MSDYFDFTTHSIESVTRLWPGDHIRVPGTGNKSFSSSSCLPARRLPGSTTRGSRSHSESDELAEPKNPEKCEGKSYTHHLLVVQVVKGMFVEVIHKVKKHNIVRELKWYKPEDIRVLNYESTYTGEYAITRAKDMMRDGEEYHATNANCEHFVTEVRTGEKQCFQIRHATAGGALGGGVGVVGGGGGGAGIGALIGGGIGSFFPVVGTMFGAGVGATIGGVVGAFLVGAAGAAGGAAGGIQVANREKED